MLYEYQKYMLCYKVEQREDGFYVLAYDWWKERAEKDEKEQEERRNRMAKI
jgi:hypothetical protein